MCMCVKIDTRVSGKGDGSVTADARLNRNIIKSITSNIIERLMTVFAYLHSRPITALFTGDGYTRDENGDRGIEEALMPNMTFDEMKKVYPIFALSDDLLDHSEI